MIGHGGIYIALRFDIGVLKYFFKGSMSMEEIIIEFLLLLIICAGSCLVYVLCIVTEHLGEIDNNALAPVILMIDY
jgi:hypothetical protein